MYIFVAYFQYVINPVIMSVIRGAAYGHTNQPVPSLSLIVDKITFNIILQVFIFYLLIYNFLKNN